MGHPNGFLPGGTHEPGASPSRFMPPPPVPPSAMMPNHSGPNPAAGQANPTSAASGPATAGPSGPAAASGANVTAQEVRRSFHTYLYDYLVRNSFTDVALALVRTGIPIESEDGDHLLPSGSASSSSTASLGQAGPASVTKSDIFGGGSSGAQLGDHQGLRLAVGNGTDGLAGGLASAASTTTSPARSSPQQKHAASLTPFPPPAASTSSTTADEASLKASLPRPKAPLSGNSQDGMLYEWWCVFWDVYRAKNGPTANLSRPTATPAAEAYVRQRQQPPTLHQPHGSFSQARREGFAEVGPDGKPIATSNPQILPPNPVVAAPAGPTPAGYHQAGPMSPQRRFSSQQYYQHQIGMLVQQSREAAARAQQLQHTHPPQAQVEQQRALHLQVQAQQLQNQVQQMQLQQERERQLFQQGRIGASMGPAAGAGLASSMQHGVATPPGGFPTPQLGPTGGPATPTFAAAVAARRIPSLQPGQMGLGRTPSGSGMTMQQQHQGGNIVERQMSLNSQQMDYAGVPIASGMPPQPRAGSRPASRAAMIAGSSPRIGAVPAPPLQRRTSQLSYGGSPAAQQLQAGTLRKDPPGAEEGEGPAAAKGRAGGKKARLTGNQSSPALGSQDERKAGAGAGRKQQEAGTPVIGGGVGELVMSPGPMDAPTPHARIASGMDPSANRPAGYRFQTPGTIAKHLPPTSTAPNGTNDRPGSGGSGAPGTAAPTSMPPPSRSASGIYPPPHFHSEGPSSRSATPQSAVGGAPSSNGKQRAEAGTAPGAMPPPSPELKQAKGSPAALAEVPASEDIRVDDLTSFLKWGDAGPAQTATATGGPTSHPISLTGSKGPAAPPTKGILGKLNTTTPSTPSGGIEGDISVPQNDVVDFDLFGQADGFNLPPGEDWNQFINF